MSPRSTGCLALLMLGLTSTDALAYDVLILYDQLGSDTTSLENALIADGHTVTYSATDENGYDGTNPAPQGFDVVLHMNGTTYSSAMTTAGQLALVSYVQNDGGGFIGTEWSAYEVQNSRMTSMTDLVLLNRTGGTTTTLTYSVVSAQSGHDMMANLSSPLTLQNSGASTGTARVFSSDPSTVLMQDQSGYDAVIVREFGLGRVVSFSHAGNYSSGVLSNSNVQALYLAAIEWSVGFLTCDDDGDGFENGTCGDTDCNDRDASVNPNATEVCDGVDNNCDGSTDGADAPGAVDWYLDVDGDGYGDVNNVLTQCYAPTGYVADDTDCDDTEALAYSGAAEVCDGVDNDCNGTVDDNLGQYWYPDNDGDGYGDQSSGVYQCGSPGSGWTNNNNDCDDTEALAWTGASEVCDGVDNDCNGTVDDNMQVYWYQDADRDGYGNPNSSVYQCPSPGIGWASNDQDCDDSQALSWTGAAEVCDRIDNDCNGTVDDNLTQTWYRDNDGDGYGSTSASTIEDCAQPSGYGPDTGDCDDNDGRIYPGASEVPYDGIDQNCSGSDLCDIDQDGFDAQECFGEDCADRDAAVFPGAVETWYDGVDSDCAGDNDFDADADGYDSIDAGGDDCDDNDPVTYPGAVELDDGLDNDCNGLAESDDTDADGLTDEHELLAGTDRFNPDTDGDGVPDGLEVIDPYDPINTDGDSQPDVFDTDDDDDGLLTAVEVEGYDWTVDGANLPDSDGDSVPDHRDTDSDDDGVLDAEDGTDDVDCDDIRNFQDADDEDGPCLKGDPDVDVNICGTTGHSGALGAMMLGMGALLMRRRRR